MIKSVKPDGRGGKRLGAGRPSMWSSGEIKSIRVPFSLADQLLEIARYLDGQESFPRKIHSFEDEESQDFDCQKAMQFSYLHHCAGRLAFQNNLLRSENESLKAQLKSIRKQKFKVL
ncbi:hypothetical protein [Microcoleus sp. D3_18_C4]|uniref:hypothetical protein n=1 Tax=Microcoleus sp. D3_18_C4 TaxID=3055335 RepID=UPI002FD377CD